MAVVFCVVGVVAGGVGVHWSNKLGFKASSTARGVSSTAGGVPSSPTQCPPSVPAEARGQVMPEYEEISLQEFKDLQLTSNTAYGIKP